MVLDANNGCSFYDMTRFYLITGKFPFYIGTQDTCVKKPFHDRPRSQFLRALSISVSYFNFYPPRTPGKKKMQRKNTSLFKFTTWMKFKSPSL